MKFRDWSIKWRIGFGFGLLIAMIGGLGIYEQRDLWVIETNQTEIRTAAKELSKQIKAQKELGFAKNLVQEWLIPILEQKAKLLQYLLTDAENEKELERLFADLEGLNKMVQASGERAFTAMRGEADKKHVRKIRGIQKEAHKSLMATITAYDFMEGSEFGEITRKKMDVFVVKINSLVDEIISLQSRLTREILRQGHLQAKALEKVENAAGKSAQSVSTAVGMSEIIGAAATAVAFIISFLVIISITRPVRKVMDLIAEMSKGNIANRLEIDQQDEIGRMALALDEFADRLSGIIREMSANAGNLATSSRQLGDLAMKVKTDATDMASLSVDVATETEGMMKTIAKEVSATEKVAANVMAVSNSSKQMSKNMEEVASATKRVTQNAGTMTRSIREMSTTISEISRNTAKAVGLSDEMSRNSTDAFNLMQQLGKSADAVGGIVKIINKVANQTNLLALNATIEAASAGEAGKGFAVVANEVKELASQTADATKQIVGQIEEMQENTKSAIQAIADITETVKEVNVINGTIAGAVEEQDATANEVTRNMEQTLSDIQEVQTNIAEAAKEVEKAAGKSEELAGMIADISEGAENTRGGASNVAAHIQKVSESSSGNLSQAEDLSQSAGGLNSLSEDLLRIVRQFTIR